jgi:hypothetical protein
MADEIEEAIYKNENPEENSYFNGLSEETIIEFKDAITFLKLAQVYVQRIDWLLSGDDGEKTFHERLKADLEKCTP